MALPATGVWEVQTGGSDANGGMFDPSVTSPGTDYTYGAGQNAIVYSDLVIQATTTQVASAGRSFVAADVGNTINIVSGTGFTTGRYNIRSVSSGIATLDRSAGTAASTGGTGTLGGALLSPAVPCASIVEGNMVYVKTGTYLITSTTQNIAGGRILFGVGGQMIGYGTTRGDSGRPTLQASGVGPSICSASGNVGVSFINIIADGNSIAGTKGFVGGATGMRHINCKAMRTAFEGFQSAGLYVRCEAASCNVGFGTAGPLFDCVARSCVSNGFAIGGGTVIRCIAISNGGVGFLLQFEGVAVNCTAYGNTGTGFNLTSPRSQYLLNCVAVSNGAYGFGIASTDLRVRLEYCAAYNNTTANVQTGVTNNNPVTLTANPFVAPAGSITTIEDAWANFMLNNITGGGAALRGAGYPSYFDVGALQHQEVASSGGSRGIVSGGGF